MFVTIMTLVGTVIGFVGGYWAGRILERDKWEHSLIVTVQRLSREDCEEFLKGQE